MDLAVSQEKLKPADAIARLGVPVPPSFNRFLNSNDPLSDPLELLSFAVYLQCIDLEDEVDKRAIFALLSYDSYENVFDRLVNLKSQNEFNDATVDYITSKI